MADGGGCACWLLLETEKAEKNVCISNSVTSVLKLADSGSSSHPYR